MTKPIPPHHFRWLSFEQLTADELYEILRVRQQVFAVEQESIYLDVDGKDQHAKHLVCWDTESTTPTLLAYLRVVAPGKKYAEPSIGRVLTRESARGTGIGKELMRLGVEHTLREHPQAAIRISAQLYLKRFYEEFGFTQVSDVYDEDGIPHIEMLRQPEP
ncbi:GNAT family N-acetyltransferase [Microbulbifer agarilyticus]|uniref:GNAT family N-acetyltransferase n=1 Tax=Microbulbifer agarilyticus TaxID=260552 RepID=UPI001C954648|nr:GNAT family N-acetyltransferase [Microbulbifer agarilyticus]MBY6189568.1 GNAT family N-acetyltransferase [Microbulbifer agarilyticus]MCA0892060.1 GNAT family N-acetyltransferase [Microbulbifer agarilyticus]